MARATKADAKKGLARGVWSYRADGTTRYTFVWSRIAKHRGKPITGWKKIWVKPPNGERRCIQIIAKLRIHANAARMQPCDVKCRASRAKVVALYSIVNKYTGGETLGPPLPPNVVGCSDYARDFVYRVGETVKPTKPYCRRPDECQSGIHFFLEKEEAIGYCM